MTPPPTIIAPLPHVAVLKVTGADAGEFLHAQLSNPVGDLPRDRCALAGWHDARGKVRAVFHVLRALDGYLLTAPAALVDQLTTTLGMFILRADVHIERTDLVASGIVAANASTSQAAAPAELPALPKSVNAVNADTNATILCVAPGCWHVLAAANQHSFATGSDCGPIVAAEIRAGLPQVDQQTTLRYVPHMLNLDKLNALDFEKGCYPGQEVIARTEHLGSVKRRARAFRIDASTSGESVPASGTPVVDSIGNEIGNVLRAARDADGSIVMLCVVTLAALDGGVHLETQPGPPLEQLNLPFA